MALLTPLWLSACVVGPDYRQPTAPLPARWAGGSPDAATKPPELSQWWLRLGDPTLNGFIEAAVADNLDVAAAKAKIRQARATYRQAGGALFPALDASGSAMRSKTGSTSSASSVSTTSRTQDQIQAGFDASWELDLFGANRRSLEAARYGMDAAQEELRSTLLTLIGDVAANYVEVRGYQTRIDLAERSAASQRQTAALTQAKFDAGGASAVDLANATGLANNTEAQIQTLQSAQAQALHRLGVLLGREPAALAKTMAQSAPIPTPPATMPLGVPADTLLSRPDVRLAERQLAQSTAAIGVAQAARYPSVSLTGSLATSGAQAGDLAKHSSVSWSFGPSVNLPLFNAGKLQAGVDIAQAQRDQYHAAFRASLLTALEDVENAIVALSTERARAQRLTVSAKAYGEAAALSRRLYQSGSTSFLEVLDAERSRYSAEDALATSQVAIATDYIALNKALGGGWNGVIDAARPEVVDTRTAPHLAAPH